MRVEKLEIIKGKKKKSYKPILENYASAIERDLKKYSEGFCSYDDVKKTVFLGVKAADLLDEDIMTYEQLIEALQYLFVITNAMGILKPSEIIQMFPISKEYDGDKYGMKDYFSTIEEIAKYPANIPIGKESINEFLMDYYNRDIIKFAVKKLCIMSKIQRMRGEKSLFEQFCEDNKIQTYSFYKNEGIIIDRQMGAVTKINKPKKRIPQYIKVLGGG